MAGRDVPLLSPLTPEPERKTWGGTDQAESCPR